MYPTNRQAELYFTNDINADWNFNVDITDENDQLTALNDAAFKGWTKVKTEEAKVVFRDLVATCKANIENKDCCLTDQKGEAVTHGFQE